MTNGPLLVKCPGCGRGTAYATSNPWRPFCSGRCRQHDLGVWANEQFRIAATATTSNDGDTNRSEPAREVWPDPRWR